MPILRYIDLPGTPAGLGIAAIPPRWLRSVDEFTIAIDGIGELTNPVEREEP